VPSIYYNDPSNGNIHYLFVRYKLPKADEFGVQISYGWLGIDCGAKAYLGNGNYGANKQGTIVVVLGNMGSWAPFGEGSPAANAYVMLCDQP
jgi:hypothetical protein